MTRVLTIKGRTGLFDIPSFILAENESLKIKLLFVDEIRVRSFRLTVRHGTHISTFILSRREIVELSPELLKESGENLDFSLALLDATGSAVIKDDYQIEPLKIEKVGGNFEFVAVVQELVAKQAEQDARMDELEKRISEFEESGVPLACSEEIAEENDEKE